MTLTLFPVRASLQVSMKGIVLLSGPFIIQKGRQKGTSPILICLSLCAWAVAHWSMAALWERYEGRMWNQVPRLYLMAPWFSHEPEVDILSTIPTP